MQHYFPLTNHNYMTSLKEIIAKMRQGASPDEWKQLVLALAEDLITKKITEKSEEIDRELKKVSEALKGVNGKIELEVQKAFRSGEVRKTVIAIAQDMLSRQLRGEPGYTPVKGKDYFDGRDGQTPDTQFIIETILGKLRVPRDGERGLTGKDGKDGSPDTPDQIVEKINRADKKIKQSAIEGLLEQFTSLMRSIREKTVSQIGGGGDSVQYYDLSSQCNGVTKTFTLPSNARRILGVWGTQFPSGGFRPLTDWTYTKPTLTLTGEVVAPATGQTLWALYAR